MLVQRRKEEADRRANEVEMKRQKSQRMMMTMICCGCFLVILIAVGVASWMTGIPEFCWGAGADGKCDTKFLSTDPKVVFKFQS